MRVMVAKRHRAGLKIARLGLGRDEPEVVVRHVTFANAAALAVALLNLPWLATALVLWLPTVLVPTLVLELICGMSLLATAKGARWCGATLLTAGLTLHLGLVPLVVGMGAGSHVFLLACVTFAWFAFPATHRRTAILLSAFAGVVAILLFLFAADISRMQDAYYGPTSRIYWDVALPASGLRMARVRLSNLVLLVLVLATVGAVWQRSLHEADSRLAAANARIRELVRDWLPEPIAERLQAQGHARLADHVDHVTVIFADIVDFTPATEVGDAHSIVQTLDEIFSGFDDLAARRGVEKIKTLGDAYMAASGLPTGRPDHAAAAVWLALDMIAFLARHPSAFRLRVGIHTGSVVAGVIGRRRYTYDVWGDTVNTAARMESHGLPGEIQVSQATRDEIASLFELEARGPIEVKGKGAMATWLVRGPLAHDTEPAEPGRAP